MSIAIYQANPTVGAISENAAALVVAARAVPAGTRLLVAPELYLIGYPPEDMVQSPAALAHIRAELDRLARELPPELGVLLGTPLEDYRGIINSAVLVEHGEWRVIAEKMILPNDGVFDEKRVFAVNTWA